MSPRAETFLLKKNIFPTFLQFSYIGVTVTSLLDFQLKLHPVTGGSSDEF